MDESHRKNKVQILIGVAFLVFRVTSGETGTTRIEARETR